MGKELSKHTTQTNKHHTHTHKRKFIISAGQGTIFFSLFVLKRGVGLLAQTQKMSVLTCDYHQQMSPTLPLGRLIAKFLFVFSETNLLLVSAHFMLANYIYMLTIAGRTKE